MRCLTWKELKRLLCSARKKVPDTSIQLVPDLCQIEVKTNKNIHKQTKPNNNWNWMGIKELCRRLIHHYRLLKQPIWNPTPPPNLLFSKSLTINSKCLKYRHFYLYTNTNNAEYRSITYNDRGQNLVATWCKLLYYIAKIKFDTLVQIIIKTPIYPPRRRGGRGPSGRRSWWSRYRSGPWVFNVW